MEGTSSSEGAEDSYGFLRAHDDLFKKKIVQVGTKPYVTPVETAVCEYEMELVAGSDSVNSCEFPASPFKIGFHDSFLCYILSRALQTMTLLEKARFTFQNSSSEIVTFDLQLLSFEEKHEIFMWPRSDRIEYCQTLKSYAAELFKKSNFFWAYHSYHRSLVLLVLADDDDEKLKDVKVHLVSNISLCQANLDCQNLQNPIANLSKVLFIEPNNVKALFRRGKHYLAQNDFERADADLEKAYALDPANQAIVEQRKLLKKKQQDNDESTASAMAKFFQSVPKL